ncbi:MAG: 1,2-phenylacetyl-CoA epoxidase subunit PaaD [Hyphomicrobiales bacterium]
MVARAQSTVPQAKHARVWQVMREVMDPELPHVSIVNLGIVRDVRLNDTGDLEVVITPTYSGCPAMHTIETDARTALDAAGYHDAKIVTQLSPAWTTDWVDDEGVAKLKAIGIAPPVNSSSKRALFEDMPDIRCPLCGSANTEQISEFGSTACKALWRCKACAEPFDYFKCI